MSFARAETDPYFKKRIERECLGKFVPDRRPTVVDIPDVIRMNRDTPYSGGVFDLTSSLTITKPFDVGADFGSPVGDCPSGFPSETSLEKVILELE